MIEVHAGVFDKYVPEPIQYVDIHMPWLYFIVKRIQSSWRVELTITVLKRNFAIMLDFNWTNPRRMTWYFFYLGKYLPELVVARKVKRWT